MTCARRERGQSLAKTEPTCDGNGINACDEESDADRHLVEVACGNAGDEINCQEYSYGAKGEQTFLHESVESLEFVVSSVLRAKIMNNAEFSVIL